MGIFKAIGNSFKKAWRGEERLSVVFWGWGVGLNALLFLGAIYLPDLIQLAASVLMVCFSLPAPILLICRCRKGYEDRTMSILLIVFSACLLIGYFLFLFYFASILFFAMASGAGAPDAKEYFLYRGDNGFLLIVILTVGLAILHAFLFLREIFHGGLEGGN